MNGPVRVAQTIARTTNVTLRANAQRDVRLDFTVVSASRIAGLIALGHVTSMQLVKLMDIAQNATLVSLAANVTRTVTQHANRATNTRAGGCQVMAPLERETALSATRTNQSCGRMGSASVLRVLRATQPTTNVIVMNPRQRRRPTRWRALSSGHERLAASFVKMVCARYSETRSPLA